MNKLLLLLLASPLSIAMNSPHLPKTINGYHFTYHMQDRMLQRDISENDILYALQKGKHYQESEEIEICAYEPDNLIVVTSGRNVLVTAYKETNEAAYNRRLKKLKHKILLKPESVLKRTNANKYIWSNLAVDRMKKRNMGCGLVRSIINVGGSYQTYSGGILYVKLPYAVHVNKNLIVNVFAGITNKKVQDWVKAKQAALKYEFTYRSNHQVTAKSLRKQANKPIQLD